MQRLLRALGLGAGAALFAGVLAGHVRLVNPANQLPLAWPTPQVALVIQQAGSDDVPDLSDETAVRLAMQDWSALDGSALALVEDADPGQRARTDWSAPDAHLILFDEDGSSGLFPGGGIVALTQVTFLADGRIRDADVLFNGRDYRFTTDGTPGAYDIQGIAAHELGHVIGLDHSGWAGATMYPYVDPSVVLTRSLSADERLGAREAYGGATYGSLSGSVVRAADGSVVQGALVTARDAAGRTNASVLSDRQGRFVLRGLDAGAYTLAVSPLEGPVSGANLGGGRTIETDFRALEEVVPFVVPAAGGASAGVLAVGPDGTVELGRSFDLFPVRLTAGSVRGVVLSGGGLASGSTLRSPDTSLTFDNVAWSGSSVSFRVSAPAGAAPGHADLVVEAPDGERAVLVGGLEIAPADPLVDSVEPSAAGSVGGTPITIRGQGFRPGVRVVIGERIYRDGVPGGVTLVDAGTLTLDLLPTSEGVHDVVVLDRTGVEGRAPAGLLVDERPVITSVFPAAGQLAGGTRVHVTGAAFQAGALVRIHGVAQDDVQVLDANRIEFTTKRTTAPGSFALEVVHPDGATGASGFTYRSGADPRLVAVQPGQGPQAGGVPIDLSGTGLGPACRVVFGVDPNTGLGGVDAEVLDSEGDTRLVIAAPALAQSGRVSVAIEDALTGQASVLVGGYLAVGDEPAGGACGATLGAPRALDPRAVLAASGWIAALALGLSLRARRARRRLAVA